jgi:7-cyano-7-deazaguanine synthase
MTKERAVVVFSGGQDSTTCLLWAEKHFDVVAALSFDYGQRHRVELDQAREIARQLGVFWQALDVRALGVASPSALTRGEIEVAADGGHAGLPSTFTPGRNLVFLSLAASYAISRGVHRVVTGVCQTDYSGYPDCRQSTIDALEMAIRLGCDVPDFKIDAPLMYLTKAQTVELARDLNGLDVLALTHTCYEGRRPACGKCPACLLRLKGFAEAGIADPLQYATP